MHAGALGWVAMISIGSLYHLIPKVFGRPQMHSIGLINAHFWLATIGTVLYMYSATNRAVGGSNPPECAIFRRVPLVRGLGERRIDSCGLSR